MEEVTVITDRRSVGREDSIRTIRVTVGDLTFILYKKTEIEGLDETTETKKN